MTAPFKIDTDIPLAGARYRAPVYPFAQMNVGDSFRVDSDSLQKVRTAASWAGKRASPQRKFAIRKHDGAYRCWRIE